MRLKTKNLDVEVNYKKISVENLVPSPVIVKRTPSGKQIVPKRLGKIKTDKTTKVTDKKGREKEVPLYDEIGLFDSFEWCQTVDGKPYDGSIRYMQVLPTEEGSEEKEVRPFERTEVIEVVKELPIEQLDEYLVESHYELFHTKEPKIERLYDEAERYWKEGIFGVAKFSWGKGFKQFYAMVYPVKTEDGFVWVMNLTRTKVVFMNSMETPKGKVTSKPTVEELPDIF